MARRHRPRVPRDFATEFQHRWLVWAPHPWRRQFSLKGRRLTVGQLTDLMLVNNFSAEEAAVNLDLPLDAIREALHYNAHHAELIAAESVEERRRVEPFLTHLTSD